MDGKKGNQYNAMEGGGEIHKLLQISGTTLRNHLDLTMDEIYGVFKLYCHPLYT